MKWFLLLVWLSSVGCDTINLEPRFSFKKTYEYKYEGIIKIRHTERNLVESGLKITCGLEINAIGKDLFLLKVKNLVFQEYNGLPGKSAFYASPKLTQKLATQLTQPMKFEYSRGRIGDIFAVSDVSDAAINIVRGILSVLDITAKNNAPIYEMYENGIHGKCYTYYTILKDKKTDNINITRSTDLNNCLHKVEKYLGMAHAQDCKHFKESGSNRKDVIRYSYALKAAEDGSVITNADVQEIQQFTPFSVKDGASILEATKMLALLSVKDNQEKPPTILLANRGSLTYAFGVKLNQFPTMITKLENPVDEIAGLMQRLVMANTKQIDVNSTTDVLRLYQMLNLATIENLESLWKIFSGDQNKRRWLLDSIQAISDTKVIIFIKKRIQNQDITWGEASQVLMVVLNKMTADHEAVEQSKEFLRIPFIKDQIVLWRTVMLGYGSLVYRYCSYFEDCPEDVLEPLHEFANNALNEANQANMVLALKAIGNAGQPSSIKTIKKFLPGYDEKATKLPLLLQHNAVLALRNIAVKDPRRVQDIALRIFMDDDHQAEVRIYACLILFETSPSMALVSTISAYLLKEKNLQVASFCYSQIYAISRSTTPDNKEASIACSVAVKILKPKFDHLSYRYSKAFHFDMFNERILTGMSADLYMVNNPGNYLPTALITRFKAYSIWKKIQPVEFGVHLEGIQEFINNPAKMLAEWSTFPKDKPLASGYVKILGQEVFFGSINKNMIETMATMAGKNGKAFTTIADLQRGMAFDWTSPFLVAETRYIQPTCLGLPAEISKSYFSILGIKVNAKAKLNPAPTDNLTELIKADIELQVDGAIRVVKDLYCYHGINTEWLQSGAELYSKATTVLPLNFKLKMNMQKRKIEIDTPPCQKENEIFYVGTELFAVSRNIEDVSEKKTPMMPLNEVFEEIPSNKPAKFQSTSSKDEKSSSSYWRGYTKIYQEDTNICVAANNFGMEVCMETNARSAHNVNNCFLYYLTGSTYIKIKLKPVSTAGPIEKIHMEINASPREGAQRFNLMMIETIRSNKNTTRRGSSSSSSSRSRASSETGHRDAGSSSSESSSSSSSARGKRRGSGRPAWSSSKVLSVGRNSSESSSSSSQSQGRRRSHIRADLFKLFNSDESRFAENSTKPAVTFKAVAEGKKTQGYEGAIYYVRKSIQLLISEVTDGSKWKMCTDTELDMQSWRTMMQVRWGNDCTQYKMAVQTAIDYNTHKEFLINSILQWEDVPEYMKQTGTSINDYIPGMAFLLGFYQKQNQNPTSQVSVTLVEVSSTNMNIMMNTPERTVYQYDIPLPFQIPYLNSNTPQIQMIRDMQGLKDECSVEGNNFKTFNDIKFTSPMPKACYHVLAQDCTSDMKFLVMMKQEASSKKEIHIRTPSGSLYMYRKDAGDFVLTLNNSSVLMSALPLKDVSGELLISKLGDSVLLQAPTFGLDSLHFDGEAVKVVIESWMRGKTCGLCGQADGERMTEFRMPNLYTAKNSTSFVHSWMVQGESCSDDCKLQRQPVKLDREVNLLGTKSKCYSVQPVLRCRPGCSAEVTIPVSVGFHCVPLDTSVSEKDVQTMFDQKAEHVEGTMEAHTACSCSGAECP
ncbi:vitellogenin isoform X2 [Amia ocellicauda]|uniref:vitellogenin isoform X2 n=1 Tax=Amia ocellicauda TaxID=2972642 RepID=UPI003463C6C8